MLQRKFLHLLLLLSLLFEVAQVYSKESIRKGCTGACSCTRGVCKCYEKDTMCMVKKPGGEKECCGTVYCKSGFQAGWVDSQNVSNLYVDPSRIDNYFEQADVNRSCPVLYPNLLYEYVKKQDQKVNKEQYWAVGLKENKVKYCIKNSDCDGYCDKIYDEHISKKEKARSLKACFNFLPNMTNLPRKDDKYGLIACANNDDCKSPNEFCFHGNYLFHANSESAPSGVCLRSEDKVCKTNHDCPPDKICSKSDTITDYGSFAESLSICTEDKFKNLYLLKRECIVVDGQKYCFHEKVTDSACPAFSIAKLSPNRTTIECKSVTTSTKTTATATTATATKTKATTATSTKTTATTATTSTLTRATSPPRSTTRQKPPPTTTLGTTSPSKPPTTSAKKNTSKQPIHRATTTTDSTSDSTSHSSSPSTRTTTFIATESIEDVLPEGFFPPSGEKNGAMASDGIPRSTRVIAVFGVILIVLLIGIGILIATKMNVKKKMTVKKVDSAKKDENSKQPTSILRSVIIGDNSGAHSPFAAI
ncbi:unnamed protein product [Caenorhabditis auriculariae]|uniref:Domain of unknown function DX domain-containing protein n=1 Tax=Caenorhabditis auriculariae TaxID=2777116 RepID=A0A8S1HU74_9PELO|nr:unnamed protein product [Caenorhabditis auriculariae]